MSVKLDTLNTKENKVSKKQYKFEPIEENQCWPFTSSCKRK